MKLIIHEHGDSSVGINPRYYEIDCPFERDEINAADLLAFKDEILTQFLQYAETTMDAFYDFEPTYDMPPELDEEVARADEFGRNQLKP